MGSLSGGSLSIRDCSFSNILATSLRRYNMPRRGQRSLSPLRSVREVRQRMSTVADSSLVNVTVLRDVIDVPVPVIVSTCAVTFK